jgi:signal transduction histidine kinase
MAAPAAPPSPRSSSSGERQSTSFFLPRLEQNESPAELTGRRSLSIGVVVGVMLLQIATDLVSGRETARVLARAVFLILEMPLLMGALSWSFRRSVARRWNAGQALLAGFGVAIALGSAFGVLYGLVAMRVPELRLHMPNGVSLPRSAAVGVMYAQLWYGLWALAFVYPSVVESARIRALQAQQIRTDAELERLRAHLEPHFLLNTLNAIAGLVTEDPREARRLLACLGDLLRDAVQETSELQPLGKQIAWLRRYAEILEARYRGSLTFRWEVAPECEAAVLPRLLLQPLVENAVKHGALRRDEGAGLVTVRVEGKDDGTLVCVVEDNGPGMTSEHVRVGAFGIQSVRRRLELEAPNASLRHESSRAGTRSIVEVADAVRRQ